MSQLKYFRVLHAWVGLLTAVLTFSAGLLLQQLYPEQFSSASSVYLHGLPPILLLGMAAAINLALGGNFTLPRAQGAQKIKLIGSLLVLAGTALIVYQAFFFTMVGHLPLTAVALLLAGSLVMLLSNISVTAPSSSSSSAASNRDSADRFQGVVKWFNVSKGFGFIAREDEDDVFVHFRAIRGEGHRTLVEGQRVEFSLIRRDKGLQADDVIPLA